MDMCVNQSLCPAQRARAEAMFCAVTLSSRTWTLAKAGRPAQLLRASQSPFTSLTFPCRHLFSHCRPCAVHAVNSAVISLRFGETDSLTSPTWGKGRERKPPASGKVRAVPGRHGLRHPEMCEKLVSCLIYLFCGFLISKRANAFLLHVRTMQTVRAPSYSRCSQGREGA